MKTPEQMAKSLYELLLDDSAGCYDTTVDLFEDQVEYEDQGGKIGIDFGTKTFTITGHILEVFNCETRSEVGDYINEDTTHIGFYQRGEATYASITYQFKTFEDLKNEMLDHTVFMYLDLDKVFN